jgi:hypothetical protein
VSEPDSPSLGAAGPGRGHDALVEALTRRDLLGRATAVGLGAMVLAALPAARRVPLAAAQTPNLADATLQAFADTMIPGRKVTRTESGADIHPLAIAGVDPLPGAVEADVLALYHHPEVGFDAVEAPFLADLQSRSLSEGADFLSLSFDGRVKVCLAGLSFDAPERVLWEAAAAVPFTAFCAAALVPEQTAAKAVGYRVMGLPGVAPNGYRAYSYRRKLSRERTRKGYLP